MKKVSQIFTLLLFVSLLSFTSVKAGGTDNNGGTKTTKLQLLSGKTVSLGSAITALFESSGAGEAQVSVKTIKGNSVLDQSISITEGFNLLKLKVDQVPAGFYIISLKTDGGTQRMPMIVK